MTASEAMDFVRGLIADRADVEELMCSPDEIALNMACPLADKDHAETERFYAHTFHKAKTICVATAFADLPPEHQIGILLHEFGHLFGGMNEAEADLWVDEVLGIDISYVNTIQWVDLTHDKA